MFVHISRTLLMCLILHFHPSFASSIEKHVNAYLKDNWNARLCDGSMIHGINTYTVEPGHFFYQQVDTYDNALASIYYLASEQPEQATRLLKSFIIFMEQRGYKSSARSTSVRIEKFQGLHARYDFSADGCPSVRPEQNSYAVDTGNMAFLGLAYGKFHDKYHNDPQHAQTALEFRKIAFDLWNYLDTFHKCPQSEGYFARRQQRYVSTEHNIDMYALSSILLAYETQPLSRSKLLNSQWISGDFVARQFRHKLGTYAAGQTECHIATNPKIAQYTPADTQSWRYLSGAEASLPQFAKDRSKRSMEQLFSERFIVPDTLAHRCDGLIQTYPKEGSKPTSCFIEDSFTSPIWDKPALSSPQALITVQLTA